MDVCPKIAEPVVIVTSYNMGSLLLSNYDRRPGTTVTVSCVSPESYHLHGHRKLTCLWTGKWDAQVPRCVRKDLLTKDKLASGPKSSALTAGSEKDSALGLFGSMGTLPYIIIAAVLLLLFLGLLFIIIYLSHLRKSIQVTVKEAEKQHSDSSMTTFSSSSSVDGVISTQQNGSRKNSHHEEDPLEREYPFHGRPIVRDYFSRYGLAQAHLNPETDRESRYYTVGDYLVYR